MLSMLGQPHYRRRVIGTEPAARSWGEFLGGPLGHFAAVGRQRWWTPLRVLLSTAVVFSCFAYLAKAACLRRSIDADGHVGLNWSGSWQYTTACYNDIIPLYQGRGLNIGGFPYAYSWQEGDLTRYMEYPVAAGLFQGILGWMSRLAIPLIDLLPGTPPADAAVYFTLTALTISLLWVLTIAMLAELAGNRVWDVVLVAASPLYVVHAFTNWDIPSIFLAVAALYWVRRHRAGYAGICIGIGTAFKLWPLYLLGAFLVLSLRHRRFSAMRKMLVGSAVCWLIINLPVMVLYPSAWSEFLRLNRERSWEWTTIYAVIARATGWAGFDPPDSVPTVLNTLTFALFAAACIAIAVLGLAAPRPPRVAELIFLIIASFLLVNKVWSPQYSLWLMIPAVLAVPRWRLVLTWMSTEAILWPVLTWHMMGSAAHGLPGWALNLVILTRDGLIIALMIIVIRQMLGKVPDPVAEFHRGQDPLAGDFAPVHGVSHSPAKKVVNQG
ncbi:DUF2029 domain-containing protein [Corynebacterium sp. 3HC-13]|nr:DUF2029 domain-containing protein [Corynebacterium poyangense]